MTKKLLDQNDIINTEILNSYDSDYVFMNNPINRYRAIAYKSLFKLLYY